MNEKNSVYIRKNLSLKCALAGIPVNGTFELTPRCNLACKMCYVRMTPEEMVPVGREKTAKEWLELAQRAKECGLVFLLLTGGEPTLRADFLEIYEGLAKMGFSIAINTNGTLFTEELKEVFHRLPPAQVNITLYGINKEQYKALCGNPKAYDNMLDAVEWLRKEGILLHMNATMIPDNVEYWEAFEQFAKDKNLELRMNTYCFPPTKRMECKEFTRLSPEDAGELTVKDILYREGMDAIKWMKEGLQKQLSSCKLDIGDPIQCMAGKSQFWINWDGSMTPCGMLNVPKKNPLEVGFDEAWNELKKQTAEIRLCTDCANCVDKKTCMNCAAVVYAETGCFDEKPEYMCKLNQAYKKAVEKYSE